MERGKTIHILFNEDPKVIEMLTERAQQEGIKRAKLIRRAIRRELGLPLSDVPGDGNFQDEAAEPIAA